MDLLLTAKLQLKPMIVQEKEVALLVLLKTLSLTIIKLTCILYNTGNIFTEIYIPKSKPFMWGIIYRPPQKIGFVNCIHQILSLLNILETHDLIHVLPKS